MKMSHDLTRFTKTADRDQQVKIEYVEPGLPPHLIHTRSLRCLQSVVVWGRRAGNAGSQRLC